MQVVLAVLRTAGYARTSEPQGADLILLNTCAIRERAEQKIWSRLGVLRQVHLQPKGTSDRLAQAGDQAPCHPPSKPVIGVLGCMAERIKVKLLDKSTGVDLVAGPDAYRDLPRLLGILQVHMSPS